MKLSRVTGLTAIALFSIVTPVQAFSATGVSQGSWGMPSNPSGSTFLSSKNAGSNNRLSWGVPAEGSFSNYVQFDGVSIDASLNQPFRVGNLTYRNGTVSDSFDGDFPLNVTLELNSPTNISQSFRYDFNIFNTPNSTGDPVLDGDILRLSVSGVSSQSFQVDGQYYTLQLLGFSRDQGMTLLNEFRSPEGFVDRASLYGQIVAAEAVPEPMTIAGLALAGVGLAAARLRRKSADQLVEQSHS